MRRKWRVDSKLLNMNNKRQIDRVYDCRLKEETNLLLVLVKGLN
jgi:hypothetical protein